MTAAAPSPSRRRLPLQFPPQTPALRALHVWLDSWSGIGHVVVGMERHGFRLSLKKYGNGDGAWVAMFHRDVMLSADGFGTGRTPCRRCNEPRGWR